MPGLDPGTRGAPARPACRIGIPAAKSPSADRVGVAWAPGSSPGMTDFAQRQRWLVASLGMPSIGHSSVPTVGRVIASTISRVASGSAIHFL